MGRKKKPEGPSGSKSFRFNAADFAEIAKLAETVGADIDNDPNESRAIRFAVRFANSKGIPLIGEVGGGRERWHDYDKAETIPVASFAGDGVVAYRVRGNSMAERHIIDGDYVLIRPQETADHGETVVAWIRGTGGVVKCYDAMTHGLYSGKGKDRWEYRLEKGDRLFGVYAGVIRRG